MNLLQLSPFDESILDCGGPQFIQQGNHRDQDVIERLDFGSRRRVADDLRSVGDGSLSGLSPLSSRRRAVEADLGGRTRPDGDFPGVKPCAALHAPGS